MADDRDLVDDLIRQVRCQETPRFPRECVLELMSAKRPAGHRANQNAKSNGVQRPFQLAAAVVGVAVAAGLILTIWPFAGSSSFAMQQVLNAVERSQTVSYTFTTYGWEGDPWPDPYVRKVRLLAPGRSRTDIGGEVQIMNAEQGRHTTILPQEKKAVIRPLYPSSSGATSPADAFPRAATQRVRWV